MTPDAVQAFARVVLLELSPDEARAIAEALGPLVALVAALPGGELEGEPEAPPSPPVGLEDLRADVPGPVLPPQLALAGVPVRAGDWVQAARFRECP